MIISYVIGNMNKYIIAIIVILSIGLSAAGYVFFSSLQSQPSIPNSQPTIHDPQRTTTSPAPTIYIPAVVEAKKEASKLESAIQKSPQDAKLYYEQAKQLYIAASLEEARKSLSEAIGIDGTQASYYKLLATIYTEEGNYEQAVIAYKKAIELDPQATTYKELAALYRFKIVSLPEAESTYRLARELDANNKYILIALAETLEAQNKKEEATAMYEQVLQLDPRNVPAQNALTRLKNK